MTRTNPTYEVHVDTAGLSLDVVSPMESSDVRFYDSGVWVGREGDRLFVPYDRIEVIREGTGETTAPGEGAAESTAGTEPETDEPSVE
ncbi:MAG: hypothetical protein ABEJ55_03740 [Halanaeroarchaeum sp.]